MKKTKLAFILTLVAGLVCLSNFIYKIVKHGKTDYFILLAGLFIIGIGFSVFYTKRN